MKTIKLCFIMLFSIAIASCGGGGGGGGTTTTQVGVPTGVTATAGNGQVTISWSAVSGATSYNIYWSTTSGVTKSSGTKISGATSPYTHASLTNSTKYYYIVTVVNSSGESVESAQVSATPTATAVTAPTGVTASAGNGQVTLTWNAVTGATSYTAYRGIASGALGTKTAIKTGITTIGYTDTAAVNGTTYYYQLTAVNANGESSGSSEVSAAPSSASGAVPSAFTMTSPVQGNASASTLPTLSWSSSAGADSYSIEIATNASFGGSDVVNTTGLSTTSYTVQTPLTAGVVYYWRVIAVNANGTTSASNAPRWFSSPLSVGTHASGVAVTPDGTRALVTNANSPGTVTVVSLATHTVTATIPVGAYPGGIAVTPDGSKAVVANSIGHSISVINLSNNTVANTFPTPCVATTLYDIAVTPDGTRAVLGDLSAGCTQSGLDIVSISTGAITFVNFGSYNGPFGVAVTPDGSSVLTTNGILGTSIKRMSLSNSALTTISGTSSSFGVAATPDGTTAIVTSDGSDTVKIISLASNTVTATIPYASNQDTHNVAITPDGSKAVVVGFFDVAIISLTTNAVLATYPNGGGSVAITPDGTTALITDSFNGALKIVRIP